MYRLFILFVMLHLSQTLPAQHGPQAKLQRLQAILDSIYSQHPETKGIAIYLHAGNRNITWYGAVGKANTQGEPLQVGHPVNIASVTKTYVAAAILRLAEQGKLAIDSPISRALTPQTNALLERHGYQTHLITIKHLLSNTSGLFDFVDTDTYQRKTMEQPGHIWSMQEQLELAMQGGTKAFNPGERFAYAETNYLLLAEMLEVAGGKPFYEVIKQELKFAQLSLHHTWFLYQEPKPYHLLPMAEQTAQAYQVNSLKLHPSFDAFGGGGLASTVADMANFGTGLFEGRIFDHAATLQQMTTPAKTNNGQETEYCLGLVQSTLSGFTAYGHGGFWGTHLKYLPELKLSVGVYVLERDAWQVYNTLIGALAVEISKP